MCGAGEAAIIKAEPGTAPSFPPSGPSSYPAPFPPDAASLLYHQPAPSPPTLSLQEASCAAHTLATLSPPAASLPLTLSLALPPALHPPLLLQPLSRSPLLSISEVTNTLLDHNCNQ